MASIQKRPPRTVGGASTYRVRFRDPAGKQRSKTFTTISKAKIFESTVEADKARGTYVDQSLGRMTVGEYAELWLAMQTYGETTREQTVGRVRRHIAPVLGTTPLMALRTSQVQSWIRAKQQELAPRTIRVLVSLLSSILNSAVDDGRMPKNVCRSSSIRLPKVDDRKIVPWTEAQVRAVGQHLPERYKVMLTITTGLGLRQGEVFGLAVEDVDWMRRVVTVRRQVRIVGSRLTFSLPKGRKVREVPLPESVLMLLASHLQALPAVAVSLPWDAPSGKLETARLVVTSREGMALNRNYVNPNVWKPALRAAGLPTTRENGMHSGRHFYASVQLEAGTSIRALADYLGHSDPGFTLRIYTHLMPQSQKKAQSAIDAVFKRLQNGGDDPLCGPNVAPGPL